MKARKRIANKNRAFASEKENKSWTQQGKMGGEGDEKGLLCVMYTYTTLHGKYDYVLQICSNR